MQTVLSSKGQAVIPKTVRDALGLMPGDRIEIEIEGGSARLTPVRPTVNRDVAAAAGMFTAPNIGKPRSLFDFDPAALLRQQDR